MGSRYTEIEIKVIHEKTSQKIIFFSGSPSSVDNEKSKSISNVPAKNPSVFGTASTASTVTGSNIYF